MIIFTSSELLAIEAALRDRVDTLEAGDTEDNANARRVQALVEKVREARLGILELHPTIVQLVRGEQNVRS